MANRRSKSETEYLVLSVYKDLLKVDKIKTIGPAYNRYRYIQNHGFTDATTE
jgi:hypothetical protein